jgi:hypothetical protein
MVWEKNPRKNPPMSGGGIRSRDLPSAKWRARRLAAMLGDFIGVDCESLESSEDFVLTNISNCNDVLFHSGKKWFRQKIGYYLKNWGLDRSVTLVLRKTARGGLDHPRLIRESIEFCKNDISLSSTTSRQKNVPRCYLGLADL